MAGALKKSDAILRSPGGQTWIAIVRWARAGAIVLLTSLMVFCDLGADPLYPVECPASDLILSTDPGQIYLISFVAPVDSLPFPITLRGVDSLRLSPLKKLAQQVIILKADDLKGTPSGNWTRYFEIISRLAVHSSAGVIGNTFRTFTDEEEAYFQSLIACECELWNHGWTHEISAYQAEFNGPGYQEQKEHLESANSIIRERLGYTMHTFGAPGNSIDENTAVAIRLVPDIKVWLNGPETPGIMSLPILWLLEDSRQQIRPAADVGAAFEPYLQWEVVVFQYHPNQWQEPSFSNFEDNLEYLLSLPDFCLMTPHEYFRAFADRDSIVVTKLDSTSYRLDFSRATYGHTFEFDLPYYLQEQPE